jgi:hypothetical protein
MIVFPTAKRQLTESRNKISPQWQSPGERSACVKSVCGGMNISDGEANYAHLLALEDVVWCPVFKAASSYWIENFLQLAGMTEVSGDIIAFKLVLHCQTATFGFHKSDLTTHVAKIRSKPQQVGAPTGPSGVI